MRRAMNVFLFLLLNLEADGMWFGKMWTPLALASFLFDPGLLLIKHSIFNVFVVALLFTGGRAAVKNRAKPMDQGIRLSLVTLALWWIYGIATGGEVKPTFTQIDTLVFSFLFALAIIRHYHTPAHFREIGKVIVLAGIWRSLMVIVFYVSVVRGTDNSAELFPHMSSHEDTVLFVGAIVLLMSNALEQRSRKAFRLLLFIPIIMLAIQFNNRRIAWAGVATGIFLLYILLPSTGKITRRINRALIFAAPVIVLYVAIGSGRTEGIFKPLAAFSSMGGGKVDASTQARDNENVGLVSMVQTSPIAGTGFGHQWIELDPTYTVPVSVFPMYHYVCHNNVLLLLAFCGALGFTGIWLAIPISVFLNRRTYNASRDPTERTAAAWSIIIVLVCINQYWGDMGVICFKPTYLVGLACAVAARLSVHSGAWRSGESGHQAGVAVNRATTNAALNA